MASDEEANEPGVALHLAHYCLFFFAFSFGAFPTTAYFISNTRSSGLALLRDLTVVNGGMTLAS
eukprot:scaffold149349_cov51-Prasinocladus_malaysianus.AAC.1